MTPPVKSRYSMFFMDGEMDVQMAGTQELHNVLGAFTSSEGGKELLPVALEPVFLSHPERKTVCAQAGRAALPRSLPE